MRDLTNSVLRMSWALPLFGMRQLINLSIPTKSSQENTTRALDAVSEAAQGELGTTFQELYAAGDKLQRGLVDATFNLFQLDLMDPTRWIPKGIPIPGVTPAQPAPAPPPSSAPGTASGGASAAPTDSSGGWGPMPG